MDMPIYAHLDECDDYRHFRKRRCCVDTRNKVSQDVPEASRRVENKKDFGLAAGKCCEL
jgi:hypothetical protein